MDKNPADEIVIDALFKRFTEHRFPRVQNLEKRVNAGETLNDSDVVFLDTVFKDAQYILRLTDKYPQYQEFMTKVIKIYSDVTQKALENENVLKNKK